MERLTVAIDGPAGAGKSSAARRKNFTRISSSFFHYKRNARYKNTGHNIIRNFFLFLSLFLFFVQTSTIEPVAALLINYTNGSVSCSYSGSFAFFPEAEAKLFDGRYPSICRSIQVISTSTTYSFSYPSNVNRKKGCNPRKDGLQPFIPYYYKYDRVKITL